MLYSYSPDFQLSIELKWLKLSAWGKANAIDPRRILCTEFGATGDFNLFQQVSCSAHGVVVTFAATQAPSLTAGALPMNFCWMRWP